MENALAAILSTQGLSLRSTTRETGALHQLPIPDTTTSAVVHGLRHYTNNHVNELHTIDHVMNKPPLDKLSHSDTVYDSNEPTPKEALDLGNVASSSSLHPLLHSWRL
ncbi:hypothetical protein BDB00DRAFT_868186 [Zychaea mexicana]|uniref:uncharacterized protein n=1 Tax=Zychaea mexicana TaxID=64656 RepID=UPI0022FE35D6|nr:uncharacterized protein BDB00DRAFT_868186 [Zychaea mexicana]KAI9497586.1 hypothetical protein BDB00DRAFT_868186 [Zychaea mexicana]